MDYIIEYINPVLIPIVICIWVVGKLLKNAKAVRDELIPVLLVPVGIAFVGLWMLSQAVPVGVGQWLVLATNSLVQGILCAAVAVWGDQAVKQIKKMEG